MRSTLLRVLRGIVITVSVAMIVITGHYWNERIVHPHMLLWFDFIILALSLCLVAMIMQDASERRKNVNALFIFGAGILSIWFVFF